MDTSLPDRQHGPLFNDEACLMHPAPRHDTRAPTAPGPLVTPNRAGALARPVRGAQALRRGGPEAMR